MDIDPDLALLQEVSGVPEAISKSYELTTHLAAGGSWGESLRVKTAILARGAIGEEIRLTSRWAWLNRELEHFRGNLLAYHVTVLDQKFRVLSAYCPPWPIRADRLEGIDITPVKLAQNSKLWVTELLWAGLLDACLSHEAGPWIVGGDLNSSETFDVPRPRGNKEVLDRMQKLGLRECLRLWNGALVPTFRTPRGGFVVHQMDHLFVSELLAKRLVSCTTCHQDRVFDNKLSDHLPLVADFS
jgi:endonuclease/exonuclease/phosphatase family metal-dependent hydrolase